MIWNLIESITTLDCLQWGFYRKKKEIWDARLQKFHHEYSIGSLKILIEAGWKWGSLWQYFAQVNHSFTRIKCKSLAPIIYTYVWLDYEGGKKIKKSKVVQDLKCATREESMCTLSKMIVLLCTTSLRHLMEKMCTASILIDLPWSC